MSLSLAAFAPHSPLLLPAVGKSNLQSLALTIAAYEKLTKSLAEKKITTVVVISPLGLMQPGAFTINVEPEFDCRFEAFGDLATNFKARGDIELAQELKNALGDKYHLQLTSVKELDYGSAVPLFFIKQKLPKIKILPLYPADGKLSSLFAFGQALRRELEISPQKIALIASGSLSQRLSKVSPAGYSPLARGWDKKIIKELLNGQTADILQTDHKTRQEVKELGLNSLAILLGAVDGIKQTPRQLSYEHPFGVGLLVCEFGV